MQETRKSRMSLSSAQDTIGSACFRLEDGDIARVSVEQVIEAGRVLDDKVTQLEREVERLRARLRHMPLPLMDESPRTAGHSLVRKRDPGGFRYYLGDRPVHAGERLYLLSGIGWMPGRFEWGGTAEEPPCLYVPVPGTWQGETAMAIPDDARLGWPGEVERR